MAKRKTKMDDNRTAMFILLSEGYDISLQYKWSVSRGYDTYGYTICTLYANGVRVATCNGGGYDMRGTVLGEFITAIAQSDLNNLARANAKWNERGFSDGREYDLYGLYSHRDVTNAGINGACGLLSVERIAKALGYEIMYVPNIRDTYLMRKVGV